MIPNIFHFICISPMKLQLYHYLGIMSAIEVNDPDTVYIYIDKEPEDSIYWKTIMANNKVVIELIGVPTVYHGVHVKAPQYKADIIRLEKLIMRGGIYMDIDNLCIKPLKPLLELDSVDLIMGGSAKDHPELKDITHNDLDKLDGISNSIIMSIPNHPFLIKWLKELPKYLSHISWAYHAVILPIDIMKSDSFDKSIKIVHWKDNFCKFCFTNKNPYIFDPNCNDKIDKITKRYTLVFYQTIVYEQYLKNITLSYMVNTDCIFTKLFKKYLNQLKFVDYCWGYYYNKEWDKLMEYSDTYIKLNEGVNKDNKHDIHLCKFFKGYCLFNLNNIAESKNIFTELVNNNVDETIKGWAASNLIRLSTYS